MSAHEIGLWLLILVLIGVIFWQRYGRRIKRYWAERKPKIKRPFNLRAKSPDDCPCCLAGVKLRRVNEAPLFAVPVWAESKKPGGPKKRIDTEGFACPNIKCDYFLERDSQVHALVGCGVRGRTDQIQWLKYQACQTRFSSRIDTPLQDLKTPPTRIELVLSFLAEGVDPSTIRRVCIPLFTTDGLRQYFWALTAHFGQWVKRRPWRKRQWLTDPRLLYAQLIKVRRGRKLKETFSRTLCGTGKAVRCRLKELGFTGTVGTSMIERWNLTFRHMIAGLARRTWSLAQEKEKLRTHVEWGRGYYHFVRIHHGLTLDRSVFRQQRFRTPAMAAALTDHVWTVDKLLMYKVPPPRWSPPKRRGRPSKETLQLIERWC